MKLIATVPLQNAGDFAALVHERESLPSDLGAVTLGVTGVFRKDEEMTPETLDALRARMREAFEAALERFDYDVISTLFELKAGDAEEVEVHDLNDFEGSSAFKVDGTTDLLKAFDAEKVG